MTEPQSPPLFGVVLPVEDPENLPIPQNGPYFIPAEKGYMVHKTFHWGRVLTPVEKNPAILKMSPFLWPEINLPKEIVGQAWAFFAKIYELRKSEAMVDITWSEKHGYRLFCPPQEASHGGVKAKRNLEHYQGQIVGTIHSHCDFGAFHSGTDTHDADGHDGLHITLGKNNQAQPEIATMISVGSIRWNFKPTELWEDPTLEKQPFPWWWIPKVGEYKAPTTTYSKTYSGSSVSPYKPHATSTASTPTPKPAPSENKPQTSIVAFTQRRKDKESTMFEEYASVDEFLYMHGEEMNQQEVKDYEDLNEVLDAVQRAFDALGLDLDYTLAPQVDTPKLGMQGSFREDEFDLNDMDPRVRSWFD